MAASRPFILATCAAWLLACADVPASNPYDPAAPESVQATGSIQGKLVLPEGFGAGRLEGARVRLEGGRGAAPTTALDADGAFAFGEVVGGLYLVVARVEGLVTEPLVVDLAMGEDRDLGEIELGAAIEESATGVAAGVARRAPSVGDEHGGIRVVARDTPWSTVTRGDGSFALVLPAGGYTLDVESPGYEPAVIEDVEVVASAETGGLEAVVRGRPGAIRGRLRVDAAFSDPGRFASASVTRATEPNGESVAAAIPEADGTFVFPGVPVGTWHVRAELAGFEGAVERASVRVDAATDLGFVDLRVSSRIGTLHGTARLARARADGHAGVRVRVRDTAFSTLTGTDGAFALPDLPANRYDLDFSHPGYGSVSLTEVEVDEGENDPLEVVLTAAPGSISGTIVLPAGFDAPGRRAEVELRLFDAADPGDAEPARPPASPGVDGFFLLDGVGAGRWRVCAHLDGFRSFTDTRVVDPGQRVGLGRVALRPDLPADGEAATVVTGVARLEDVPGDVGHGGVRVEVEGSPFTAVTSDAGTFQVTVLARETESLRFFHEGYASPAPVEVRGLVRGVANPLAEPVLLGARPGVVRGRILLDRFGDAVLTGRVALHLDDGERALPRGVVGPDGSFTLGAVPAGAYTLRATLPAYRAVEVPVEVGVGAEVDTGALLLRHLSGTAAAVPLGGRVRLADAVDHAGVRVRARFVDRDRPFAVVVTDSAGRFEVPAADEAYNLVFERPGYGTVNPFGPVGWDGEAFADADGGAIDVVLSRAPFDGRITARFGMAPGWIGAADSVATVRLRGAVETPAPVNTAAGEAARFSGLAAGPWAVTVERPGFTVAERIVELGPGLSAVSIDDVELRLIDLSAARLNLSGRVLSDDDLAGISVAGADLNGVRLTGDFSGVDFSGADLTNADLRGADLRGARLEAARLFGADLRGADLRGADLRQASLFAADLSPGADGRPSRLEGADLRFADLSFAQLRGAVLAGGASPEGPPCTLPPPAPEAGQPADGVTRVGGARFGRADLEGAVLDGLFFAGTPEVLGFAKADLSGARLVGAGLARTCLRGVELSLADLSGARLVRADLRGASLVRAVLQRSDLRGADLRGAELLDAVLVRARLDCLEMEAGYCACAEPLEAVEGGGACDEDDAGFVPADWTARCGCRTRLSGAALSGANLVAVQSTGADLRGASLLGVTTGDAVVDADGGVDYPEAQPIDCALPDGCDWPPGDGCDLAERPACRVVRTRFAQAALDGADLSGTRLAHVDFTDASLRDARLGNAIVSADTTLRGVEAAGLDLSDATLRGVDLTGLRAPGARLRRTDLVGAVLVDVDLAGAELSAVSGLARATVRRLGLAGAVVRDTELPTDAKGLDLRGADVTGAAMVFPAGARLDGATLHGVWGFPLDENGAPSGDPFHGAPVSLRGADLRDSVLAIALTGCDATGARIGPVQLPPAQAFVSTLLRDADLDALVWRPSPFDGFGAEEGWWAGSDLRGASLRGLELTGADFRGTSFAGADLTGAMLRETSFVLADLSGGALVGARMEGRPADPERGRPEAPGRLTLVDLRDAGLGEAELHEVVIHNADLRGADLRGLTGSELVLHGSDLRGAQLRGAEIAGGALRAVRVTSLAGLRLDGADLSLVDVTDADLSDLQMNGGRLVGVNVADAAATAGMVLNPDERLDARDRVGRGVPPSPAGHLCGVIDDCGGDVAAICDAADAACAAPDYPANPCAPLAAFDSTCLLVERCAEWRDGAVPERVVRNGCTSATGQCCGEWAFEVNLARSDLTRALPPLSWIAGSNLDHADLSGVRLALQSTGGATFAGADLSGATIETRFESTTLAEADLSRIASPLTFIDVDLREARLDGATPPSVQLFGVSVRGASVEALLAPATAVRDVDIRGAALEGARLPGLRASRLFFEGANLAGADLSGAEILWGLGAGANLAGANLAGAVLAPVSLWEADLSGARLDGAILRSPLFCADLSGASLRGARLDPFYPFGCVDLTDADLRAINLVEGDLWEATLTGADLTGVDLSGHVLADTELVGATLVGATLVGTVVSGANLAGADLSGADAAGLLAIAADLRGAVLSDAVLTDAWLHRANLAGADLAGADLAGADLARANLVGADLRGATTRGARFTGAVTDGARVCASAPARVRALAGVEVDEGC